MTSRGVPPDAPPGQERWPGHWTPSVEAEPLRHTLPAGALHGLQAALPLTENVPNSHTVQSVSPSPAVYLPEGHTVHVAVAAEVDPEGPCLPAAHAAPEHVEAPAVGTHTYHIWIREKLRAYIRFEVGALLPVSLDMHACCLYPLGLRHASACALILPCVSL